MYLYLILGFIVFVILRFYINISKFFYLKKALNHQWAYLEGKDEDADKNLKSKGDKAERWIVDNSIEIKKLVLETGLEDHSISFMDKMGLGFAKEKQIKVLDNLLVMNSDIMGLGRQFISQAKGYYKVEAFKSLKIQFWVETILFLPKNIFLFLGLKEKNKITNVFMNLCQLLYWGTSLFFMYIELSRLK